jgi:predicted flap endonuclease-1-like 5' DNA nuclease
LEKLRNATPEEMCELNGIGPKLAERLHDFLGIDK